jgi:rhodanese-related sulfurtransferase
MRNLIKLIPGCALIVAVAAVLGLTVNAVRPNGLPLIRKPLSHTRAFANPTTHKPEALFTTLKDAKDLYDRHAALFIDARTAEDYQAEHISDAVSLYFEDFDKLYGSVMQGIPKDRQIVTYCSDPECQEATKLADALTARGYTKVMILLEGLPGWKNAGYPTAPGKGR